MATRPCKAWKTPDMIIMIAANMMNPTAQPLVCRPAREDASLLTADPSSASDDPTAPGHLPRMPTLPFGMSCAGGKPPLGGAGCRIGRIVASGPIAIITLCGGGLPACRAVSMSAGEKLDAPRPTSYQIVIRGRRAIAPPRDGSVTGEEAR